MQLEQVGGSHKTISPEITNQLRQVRFRRRVVSAPYRDHFWQRTIKQYKVAAMYWALWRFGATEACIYVEAIAGLAIRPATGDIEDVEDQVLLEVEPEPERERVHIGVVLLNHVYMSQ